MIVILSITILWRPLHVPFNVAVYSLRWDAIVVCSVGRAKLSCDSVDTVHWNASNEATELSSVEHYCRIGATVALGRNQSNTAPYNDVTTVCSYHVGVVMIGVTAMNAAMIYSCIHNDSVSEQRTQRLFKR